MPELAGIDSASLRRYVDRIVALHDDRKNLNEDFKAVYEEAREAGIVTRHLRTIVREALMESEERETQYTLLASYRVALGMLAGTPLGDAAEARAAAPADAPADDGGGPGAVRQLRRGPGRPRKPALVTEPANGHDIGEPLGAA